MYPYELFLGIHMYGIMIAVGIGVCFAVLILYSKRLKIEPKFVDFVFYDGLVSIIFGFLSAAVFQGLYEYIENPQRDFHIDGGITFMGGLLGGAVSFLIIYFIFRKKYKSTLKDILPVIACCILIAHAFGRVGCFFAGCCYGKETDSIWGVKFLLLEHKVFPTNLYEAVFLFITFGLFSLLSFKNKYKNLFSFYLIFYGVFRFFIEFLRGDDRGAFIGTITPSQFWSLLFVVAGLVLLSMTVFKQSHNRESFVENNKK